MALHHNLCVSYSWKPISIVLSLMMAAVTVYGADEAHVVATFDGVDVKELKTIEPSRAVLFPWFAEAIGVIVFFILTRYLKVLPFTAVMFLLGMFIGFREGELRKLAFIDQLAESIELWGGIDFEVLFLIFLPGLVFRDAFGLNVHLFVMSIGQTLIMAFPMVLAGTVLTALVAYYIFPFGWGFNLCMTFGAILSATDPVAVNALMNEVGAPPRLRMHIAGESLLNDGSAMVFYLIFSAMFLADLGIPGLGEEVDLARGVTMFFWMSVGGAAIGVAFGLILVLVLFLLNRRLDEEENVLQVASTVTIAYLTYYVADPVCETSGVIATLMCGVTAQAFGGRMINDNKMMESFWELLEHLLNTLLFMLGGLVWGSIVANTGARAGLFHISGLGYLVLLYLFLTVIRTFLVFAHYPLISRMGLGSSLKECVFLVHGGLRGAVGITLGLALDDQVWKATDKHEYRAFTTTLFGMVGGIALLTLVVNGTSSGPLLARLGLAKSSDTRVKIVASYRNSYVAFVLDAMMDLLADPRFHQVDLSIVRYHLSFLESLSEQDIDKAIERRVKRSEDSVDDRDDYVSLLSDIGATKKDLEVAATQEKRDSIDHFKAAANPDVITEFRNVFIELLRSAYQTQIDAGELDGRLGFVAYSMLQSLEYAADEVSRGTALKDWEAVQAVGKSWSYRAAVGRRLFCGGEKGKAPLEVKYQLLRGNVRRFLAFVEAHRVARDLLQGKVTDSAWGRTSEALKLSAAGMVVLEESKAEVAEALKQTRAACSGQERQVSVVVSHFFCSIILNKAASYVATCTSSGLLQEREGREFIEEIEKVLEGLEDYAMHSSVNPDELPAQEPAAEYGTFASK